MVITTGTVELLLTQYRYSTSGKKLLGKFGTCLEIWPSWLDWVKVGKIGGKGSKFPGIPKSLGQQYVGVEKS
jgi:hypothetical protein